MFKELIKLLDSELNSRYGKLQSQYEKYNKIEALDTVVIGYDGDKAVGCGCFKVYSQNRIEIKRMFVKARFRGTGLASEILQELEKWGIERKYSGAMLETGVKQPEAIRFYTKHGYHRIDNYGQYEGISNSICMSKELKE